MTLAARLDGPNSYIVRDGEGIAQTIGPKSRTDEEHERNALLLAASEDLLEACQYLCAEIHNGCTRKDEAFMRGVRMAEDIIARAEPTTQ